MVDNTSIQYVFVNAIAPEEVIKSVCEGDIIPDCEMGEVYTES